MNQLLQYRSFYLVGIKGVAMTSLAACLVDAGKQVRGSDTGEEFVTQPQLKKLGIQIDVDFNAALPVGTDCVIYTAAHQGKFNPQVVAATDAGLPCLSQAEAMAQLFNDQQGVAVCGVGGKSTTSAMISWMLTKTAAISGQPEPSYSVGVGEIPGLPMTGHWQPQASWFIAEADEYVIDASAPSRGEPITPRFSFMRPAVIVCTNLRFDHPDVYQNFEHTQAVFKSFFLQLKPQGKLVVNGDDQPLLALAQQVVAERSDVSLVTFGERAEADVRLSVFQPEPGLVSAQAKVKEQPVSFQLKIPGRYNVQNALAALAVVQAIGGELTAAAATLTDFRSTKRRAEFVGEKRGVKYYDDYAHHPHEVAQVIHAFREWFPTQRLVIGFQSHTFSRTKALFADFATAFAEANEVVMIDIFPSAREPFDATITSEMLCEAIQKATPSVTAQNVRTIEQLAAWCKTELQPGDVFLSIGAGDIYQVHELI